MAAYYNENNPFAAQWLRNLIQAGLIAPGDVDERDIRDVLPDDISGYDQCHFFAGIGGWSRALRLAGWPDDRPVWTGSCPCQPFSKAGQGKGFADERHLWPAWFHLIGQCRPPVVFGEQVEGQDALAWLDLVQADMETTGYAFGAVNFPAAGIGAPQIRQRLFWVANATELFRASSKDNKRCGTASPAEIPQFGNSYCQEVGTTSYWNVCEPPFPVMADGIPGRVGQIRAYGNAIVPQAAAEVIAAYMETSMEAHEV